MALPNDTVGNLLVLGDLTVKGTIADVDLNLDLNPIYVDKSSGAVQIGSSGGQADAEVLYVKAGDDGLAVDADSAANLILEDSGANYISIRNPDANDSGIRFNVGTDADASSIDHVTQFGTDYFRFKVAGTNALYVTSNPAVLINSGSRADAETLYVKAGDDGITVATDATQKVIVENTTSAFIGFRTGSSQPGGLRFNRGTDPDGNIFHCTSDGSSSQFLFTVDTVSSLRIFSNCITLPVTNDAGRPAAGTAGRVFYSSTDGNLNIDNGTNWILPDGTTT